MSHPRQTYTITPSLWIILILATIACIPGFWMGLAHQHPDPVLGTLIFGVAVFGAAFMLSWAAEAAQIDISESLAIAILALIAVLPEYAVDFVFTWKAASDPEQAHYALANMTGANRLLVGLGWPVIIFLYIWAKQKKELVLEKSQHVEIFYLGLATLYSFTIPLKGSLNLVDTFVLVSLYILYARRASQLESEEPELVGPVKIIANQPDIPRRIYTILLFLFSGSVIFFVAEPFAEALVGTGAALGVDEFFLVQWLAPIASETPEFLIAATWTLRGSAGSAMRALISSKVNHWTLLVGTIPLVFSIASGEIRPFLLDVLHESEGVQVHELYLTAAQSLFAVAVLLNLRLNRAEGFGLAILFLIQLIYNNIRVEITIVYVILGLAYIVYNRKFIGPTVRTGLGLKEK